MNRENLEKLNTVPSKKQTDERIFFEGKRDGKPRIMLVGNSITFHAPKEEIGWSGAWGMAASAKEKDYVHLVMSAVQEKYPDAAFCIVQAAVWERNYRDADNCELFGKAAAFNPDIIGCAISGNIPNEQFEKSAYKKNLKKLLDYLSGGNSEVKVIVTSSFFGNEVKNAAIREYAEEENAHFVYISDISEKKENLAIGQFWHEGVQIHPGDKGMQCMAERYIKAIYSSLLKK